MAVMRWKCSLLSPNELTTLQEWVNEQQRAREKVWVLPWSEEAREHGDEVFAENTYVQQYAA